MREFSLAPEPQWWPPATPALDRALLTTIDAARALRMTDEGVRWLARTGQLACERTRSGQYLFRPDEILRVGQQRVAAALATVRPRMLRVREGPRQLPLFGAQRFRPARSTWGSSSERRRDRSGIRAQAS